MAYTLKYRYFFTTHQGDECRVDIDIKDAEEGLTILNPGIPPFVLREFNSDKDFFKHVRPMMAEMTVLSDLCSMEDFLHPEDDGVRVRFYFRNNLFWQGWLMQDDTQEVWIDTLHYIVLRATDGIGQVGSLKPVENTGQEFIYELLKQSIENTAVPNLENTVVCNLFYEGMQDRSTGVANPLEQVKVEVKTFQGDNRGQILEKILKAWGMTLFQFYATWWFIRLEEWMNNLPIQGIRDGLIFDTNFTSDFKVNIGSNHGIYPVMPEMLRQIRRPFKETEVRFFYRFPDEIVCNQTFLSGSVIPPTLNRYTIDCWDFYKTTFGTLTAGTATRYREEITDIDGNVVDNYVFIGADPALHYLRSQPIYLNQGDRVTIGFDYRVQRNASLGPATIQAAAVLYKTSTANYTLNDSGDWIQSNASFTTNFQFIDMSYSSAELLTEWKNRQVTTNGVPGVGEMYICLVNNLSTDSDSNHKGLEIEIREASKQPGVIGDYDRYTQTGNITQNYVEEVFLDDSNNRAHKGALFFNNDLTGDRWYRMDYPAERLTFKRHKALALSYLNKRYRNFLEVTMYGIKTTDNVPVWLHNRLVFSEDAPNMQYMIVNLREMDFMNATWKADLIEVWDSDDSSEPIPHSFANIYQRDV